MRHSVGRLRVLALLAVTACGSDPRSCTLVGCVSELKVQVPVGTTAAKVCIGGFCTSALDGTSLALGLSRKAAGATVATTVTVTDAKGTTTSYDAMVVVTKTRPNGPTCPPDCYNASVRVDPATRSLVPV